MVSFTSRISKTLHDRPLRFAFAPLLVVSAIHFAGGCGGDNSAGNSSGSMTGSASGSSSGMGSGTTAGSGSGATSGSSSGAMSGATSGSSSGAMSGAGSGAASGGPGDGGDDSSPNEAGDGGSTEASGDGSTEASGDGSTEEGGDGSTEAGDDGSAEEGGDGSSADGGSMCSTACTTAAGCPAQSCYLATANPTGNADASTLCDGITQMPKAWKPQYAIDGDPATRYSTCTAGVGTEWFQVDMCRAALVSGVTLFETMNDLGDQAKAYNVEVSTDGTNWTSVAMSSSVPAGTSLLTVTFTPVTARYVRFNQTGMVGVPAADGGFTTKWWSIHEFNVTCGGSDAAADGAAASDAPASDGASDAPGE